MPARSGMALNRQRCQADWEARGMVRLGWQGGQGYEEYSTLEKMLKKITK